MEQLKSTFYRDDFDSPEREALHKKIIEELLEGGVPDDEPIFYMTGGGSASGKSQMLKLIEGEMVKASKSYVVLDSDEIKKMLPEYNELLKKGGDFARQAASVVHEESSYLVKKAMSIAKKRKFNIVLDGTGDNGVESIAKKVDQMRGLGYAVKAKYATVDVDIALKRALQRARKTKRYVPAHRIVDIHIGVSQDLPEALKRKLFDDVEVFDMNTIGRQKRIARYTNGKLSVKNQALWHSFLDKGNLKDWPSIGIGAVKEGNIYTNTIDLNRFSNGVSRKLIESYNRTILDSLEKLKKIEALPKAKQPAYRAARLRGLLRQTRDSLNSWSDSSAKQMIQELDGIAKLQTEFAQDQLDRALPAGSAGAVRSIEITESFARSVVETDPLELNANVLSDTLTAKVKGVDGLRKAQGSFNLTAKQGATINLPNGETIKKAFRGLAARNAERFGREINDGLLRGETTEGIGRRLVGSLSFGQRAKTAEQLRLAGGSVTKMATHQIQTIVRTSVQQVSNKAAQNVYMANKDVTSKYRWLATLDSKTAPECRELDQEEFEYGQGPVPPQHLNCRCRTIAVVDYEKLGLPPPDADMGAGRSSETGQVARGTTYGQWASKQSEAKKKEIFGVKKAAFFNKLSKKYGPDAALSKFVRSDGSEKTLAQMEKTYGKPKPKKRARPKPKAKVVPVGTGVDSTRPAPVKKPVAKKAVTASPVENRYIKRMEKWSDEHFQNEYDLLKSDLEFKKVEAYVITRSAKVGTKRYAKAKAVLTETEDALKVLSERWKRINREWRTKHLPQPSGPLTSAFSKESPKELAKKFKKYEKKLAARRKKLDPMDPLLEEKMDSIRGQEYNMAELRKKLEAGHVLDDTDWVPMGYIYEQQGFNAKPKRVARFKDLENSTELMQAADGKNLIMYRGVGQVEYADQFKGLGDDGGIHYPGVGMYGNGTYAASRNFYVTGKVGKDASYRAYKTAQTYAWTGGMGGTASAQVLSPNDVNPKKITAFGLKKDARVVIWEKGKDIVEGADAIYMEWVDDITDQAYELTGMRMEIGEAAATLGIDAYQAPGVGVGDGGEVEDYWVIFNRGALIVSDEAG